MSKLIGIIGVALMATVAQPVVSAASWGRANHFPFEVRTAPVQTENNRTATKGQWLADQSVRHWVQHARVFLFWVSPTGIR